MSLARLVSGLDCCSWLSLCIGFGYFCWCCCFLDVVGDERDDVRDRVDNGDIRAVGCCNCEHYGYDLVLYSILNIILKFFN